MKINNVKIYGLKESIAASRYPMSTNKLNMDNYYELMEAVDNQYLISKKLGSCEKGSGHDCFLKGIVVQFDITMSQLMYQQISRYHFIDFVSSMSKMHRITKMDLDTCINENTDEYIKERFKVLVDEYNNSNDDEAKAYLINKIYYSIPMGLELTARMTTNYLQLKTIYAQRKNHRLSEWREFCKWVESLPQFKKLTIKGYKPC